MDPKASDQGPQIILTNPVNPIKQQTQSIQVNIPVQTTPVQTEPTPLNHAEPLKDKIITDRKDSNSKSNKNMLILLSLVILIVLIFGGSGYYLSKNNLIKNIPIQNLPDEFLTSMDSIKTKISLPFGSNIVQKAETIVNSAPTSKETIDWKAYQFADLSFKIPKNWPIKINEDISVSFNQTSYDFVKVVPQFWMGIEKNTDIKDYADNYIKTGKQECVTYNKCDPNAFKTDNISVDGKKEKTIRKAVKDSNGKILHTITAFIQYGKDQYVFSVYDYAMDTKTQEKYFNLLLSTFKFKK